jgi:CheY-like chemotaxis protein
MNNVKKRILVADDQQEIRTLLYDMLSGIYDVTCVGSGHQLYALMTSCRNDFDLIITDMCMDDWDGEESVDMARGLGVEIPVLYITGGTDEPMDKKRSSVLYKPFQGSELIRRVQTMLHQKDIDKLLADVEWCLEQSKNETQKEK